METNRGTIVLAERAVEYATQRSVLRDWGYEENEIQRFLDEPSKVEKLDQPVRRRPSDVSVPERVQTGSL